jgi:hypothetical protein
VQVVAPLGASLEIMPATPRDLLLHHRHALTTKLAEVLEGDFRHVVSPLPKRQGGR